MRNENCTLCDLHKQANTICLWGRGNKYSKLAITGQNPGLNEDEQGKPFIGASGKYLSKALKVAGLKEKEIYITNCVKCHSSDNKTPDIGKIKKCSRNYLIPELKEIKPFVIITLGKPALNGFFPDFSGRITDMVGNIIPYTFVIEELIYHNCLILPNYHPAYTFIYSKDKKTTIKTFNQILKLGKILIDRYHEVNPIYIDSCEAIDNITRPKISKEIK